MTRISMRMIRIGVLTSIVFLVVQGGFFDKTRLLVVVSGSMEPAIPVGSLIVVRERDEYVAGEVISFVSSNKAIITHRILRVETSGGKIKYITKGDRNEEEDRKPVYYEKVAGKVTNVIPKLGGSLITVRESTQWLTEMISRAILIDQEVSSGNNLTAGTMDLKISDDDEEAGDSLAMTWEGDGFRPGEGDVSADLKIKNSGTVAAEHIHVSVENSIGEGEGPGEDDSDPMDANLKILSLYYNKADIKSDLSDRNGNGIIDLDDWEKTPAEDFSLELTDLDNDHTLSLTVGLRPETSAADQGDMVETTFLVIGHQLESD